MMRRRLIAPGLGAAALLAVLAGCAAPAGAPAASDASDSVATAPDAPRPAPESATGTTVAVASDPDVIAQLDYVLAHWSEYNDEEWGVVGITDCVNFASQALIARGWEETDEWYHSGDVYESSATWRSSTAMRDWLAAHPELATPLDDTQRDQVRLGDIVQFDWDQSGDRDHTGIVTRIERTGDTTKISFAGHTLDSDYRDVDVAITEEHPGGVAYYWRLSD
jgi:hypothetical protein